MTTIGISGISPYLCTPVVGPVTISGEIDAGRIQHLKLLIRVNLVHNRRVALGPRDVGGLGAEPDDVCADKDQSRCHEHEEWLQRRVVPQGGHIHPLHELVPRVHFVVNGHLLGGPEGPQQTHLEARKIT